MRKGSGTPTASMQMSIGKAHQPKKQPIATDHTCSGHRGSATPHVGTATQLCGDKRGVKPAHAPGARSVWAGRC